MIKQVVIIGCLTAAGAAEAHQLKPARLAPSPFADTEVSTNVTCNLNLPSLKMYRLALGLVATTSNEVEVVIGADADRDRRLSFDEQGVVLACDGGEWILGGMRDEVWGMSEAVSEEGWRFVTGGPDTNGVVWAYIEVDIRRHKSNPAWLYSDTWNLMKVTRRGVDDPLELVKLETRTSGTIVILR